MPFPISEDNLQFVSMTPAYGFFVSDHPSDAPEDFFIEAFDSLEKHACWPDIYSVIGCLLDDFNNLFTSVAKIDLFHSSRIQALQSNYVTTELEYMSTECKSIFDLFQTLSKRLWKRVQIVDQTIIKRELPDTYSKMILNKEKLMDASQIVERYAVSPSLANFYHETAQFFLSIRKFRDDIVHHGKVLDIIFVTEDGFAISKESFIYNEYESIFDKNSTYNKSLYSIRPLLKYWIETMLGSFEKLVKAHFKQIRFPPSMLKDIYRVWLRCPNIGSYKALIEELKTSPWWHSPQGGAQAKSD